MAPNSPIFLDVDDYDSPTTTTTQRRHRSNEDLDFLKEQDRWRRHEEARQMVRYRDKNHFGATTQQRSPRDHLAVPVYEVSPRRPRARSDTRPSAQEVENLHRDFKTLEVRPSSRPRFNDDDDRDPMLSNAHERGSTQSRDPAFSTSYPNPDEKRPPKIKIPPVIIQEHPPNPSPRPGSRSPSSQPQLQVKYLTLQNKLSNITLGCIRYIDVEAANPKDLTFEKISEQVRGFAFELRVWHHISNIEGMPRSSVPDAAKSVVDAAGRNLDRLIERVTELCEVVGEAEPGDLKFKEMEKLENGDEDNMFLKSSDDHEEEENADDIAESRSQLILSSLHSIKLQIQHLKRLSRSLQDATPAAQEETAAVSSLVNDVDRYFGSDDAVRRNGVDKKYSGRRALQEARWGIGG